MPYHYLVASLPTLTFGDQIPFSSRDFLSRCTGVLKAEHLAILAAVLHGQTVQGSSFAASWTARETQLRNALARFRGARLGVDSRSFEREHTGFDVAMSKAITDALAQHTPLEREQALDRCRWHVVEELALPDPFGLAAVLAFAIKLRIAERWAALNETVGERKVEDFIAAMTNAQSQAARGNDPELRKRLDRASEMSEP